MRRKRSAGPAPGSWPREDSTTRVMLVTEWFHPLYSGAAVRFGRYLPGFRDRGVDVRVVTCTATPAKAAASELEPGEAGRAAAGGRGGSSGRRPGSLLPVEWVEGVPVHRVDVPARGVWRCGWMGWRAADLCDRPGFRPSAVQALSLDPAMIAALLRFRRLGVPVVYTQTMAPRPSGAGLGGVLARRRLAAVLGLVDRVVVPSALLETTLRESGVRTRIEVIPNGVDTRRFHPPTDTRDRIAVRRRLGVPSDAPLVLYVGGISSRKGVDLLLEAWGAVAAAHPGAHLVLAGPRRDRADPSHGGFRVRLERLQAASGAADRVHFPGLVPDVESYMRAADVFAFASHREGMPNAVLEAMASGLPVVTTPFLGLSDELGVSGRHYWLSEAAPSVLASRIDRLLREPRRRESLGASGRDWVEPRLALERSIDLYAQLYHDLASSAVHGPR